MSISRKASDLFRLAQAMARHPRLVLSLLEAVPFSQRGFNYSRNWNGSDEAARFSWPAQPNRMQEFCDTLTEGPGVWKWDHYLDIYNRHLQKFMDREVHVMEVGVYSGGGLRMLRNYFGERSQLYGVDIEADCKCYANDHTKIFIGDQEERSFWRDVRKQIPCLDVLIDDGGHEHEQQITTLEEMLPHLSPGGVYICEDIRGDLERFNAFAYGLISSLSKMKPYQPDGIHTTPFQSNIASIHCYPYVTIIEKASNPIPRFVAPKRGTQWQPFLDGKLLKDVQ